MPFWVRPFPLERLPLISTDNAELNNLLQETLFNLRTTFISLPLDLDYFSVDETLRKSKLIAFYRDDTEAKDVIDIFKKCRILNCSEYFSRLLKQQEFNMKQLMF